MDTVTSYRVTVDGGIQIVRNRNAALVAGAVASRLERGDRVHVRDTTNPRVVVTFELNGTDGDAHITETGKNLSVLCTVDGEPTPVRSDFDQIIAGVRRLVGNGE